MLDNSTKKRIDDCRDILVGKLPDPKSQIEQITIALIYKFMDDMDKESIDLGGAAKFFSDFEIPNPSDKNNPIKVEFKKYSWDNLFAPKVTANELLKLYSQSIESMEKNPNIPQLFRDIFKNAYLPYRDPETLKLFLKTIGEFEYTHSEKLGDAFEYLLSVMGSQGDAGQFRTPRHIIDFIVEAVDPGKTDTILDPACGTAGFLISAFKHIRSHAELVSASQQIPKQVRNDGLTPDERKRLIKNFIGYDISPDMVRLSLVNLYLHGFSEPHIFEYDTLTSEERWNDSFDVVLANPPFMSPKGGIRPHKKFTVTSNRSEVLFVDYIAEHLNPNGRAGVIVPEGVIFQSGKAYKELRKILVDDYLYGVVSLPAGIFNPYSGVKTSILLMDKAIAKKSNKILFIKIDNDGYNLGAQRIAVKGGQLAEAIEILKQFKTKPDRHSELVSESAKTNAQANNGQILKQVQEGDYGKIAHAVEKSKIAENGEFNLSGERYKERLVINSDWPLVELVEVLDYEQPTNYIVENTEYKDDYKTPVLTAGKSFILGYTNEKEGIFSDNLPVIIFDDFTTATKFVDFPFKVKSSAMKILKAKNDKANIKFLYYLMQKIEFDSSKHKRYWISQYSKLKIPLPPLSIQKEIVAEIEGYQKIIDGAKMVVKNYKPQIDIDPDWEMVELENNIDFISGLTLSIPKSMDNNGTPIISMNSILETGELVKKGIRKIKLPNKKTINFLKKGDLLFNWRNGSKHLVGKTAIFNWEENSYVFASFLLGIRPHIDKYRPKFLWYLLNQYRSYGMYEQFMRQNINGLFNREELKILKMPIVPINIQDKIVEDLDNQRTLVNANKKLIEIFEQKIKDRISKVWGEEKKDEKQTLSMAAEPKVEYAVKK